MTTTPEYARDRRLTLLALGICGRCGKADRAPGRATCPKCLVYYRQANRDWRAARKLAGVA